MASRKGWLSISPMVPPISVMTTSAFVCSPTAINEALDLIGDMGDHLHGAAAGTPLDAPCCSTFQYTLPVVRLEYLIQVLVDEPLIMAQIQIRLRTVLRDIDLAVLIGAHGARDPR